MDTLNIFCMWKFKKQHQHGVQTPQLVQDVFHNFSNNSKFMENSGLEEFWREYQKEPEKFAEQSSEDFIDEVRHFDDNEESSHAVDGSVMKRVINQALRKKQQNEPTKAKGLESGAIDANLFFKMLMNPAFTPAVETKVSQDMNASLSHYYVFTGHNSYLKGNQLTSQSSEKPIQRSLEQGVRVIELDLWPNEKKTGVNVMHGGTLTRPISFEKCVETIKKYAFVATPYPVILTLESHISNKLQRHVAEVLTTVFGDLLWVPPEECSTMVEYPSPESLKGRILVSTQPPKADKSTSGRLSRKNTGEGSSSPIGRKGSGNLQRSPSTEIVSPKLHDNLLQVASDANVAEEGSQRGGSVALDATERSLSGRSISGSLHSTDSFSPDNGSNTNGTDLTVSEMFQELTEGYRKMIAIAGGRVKGEAPRVSLQDGPVVKRVSLSETQLISIAKTYPEDVVRFTQRNILRIYPTGMRVDSSNYDPMPGWIHGAQLVALNMQGYGQHLWAVQGFFRGNGGAGYIKKPDYLLQRTPKPDGSFDYWNPNNPGDVKFVLKVRLLLGTGWLETLGKNYFDKFSPPDFYTKISVRGVPADKASKKLSVKQDMWNPSWENEVLEFPLRCPDLAILKIKVFEYDQGKSDEFAGQIVLPIKFLKEGFRCVPLFDKKGLPLRLHQKKAKIDANTAKTEPVECVTDKEALPSNGGALTPSADKHQLGPRLLFHFQNERK